MDLDLTLDLLAREPETAIDVATVALMLARDEYPNLNVGLNRELLSALADGIRPDLGSSFEARVSGLRHFLFQDFGLSGNKEQYYDPRNSYLNDVLDRRLGIPITLSLVAIEVGRHLGLSMDGVALPGHFVAMAHDGDERIIFDAFDGGRLLDHGDCEKLVSEATGNEVFLAPESLTPASSGGIVTRILTNLKACYLRSGDFERCIRVMNRLRQIAPNDWTQARDIGASYLQIGQSGHAIDSLNLYLKNVPDALDREGVAKLIRKARSELSQWN